MIRYGPIQKKPRRKFSRRWLEGELDRLVSLIVRNEHPSCVICFSVVKLECGHFYGRAFRSTRWELANLATLCHSCNQRDNRDKAPFRDYQLNRLGPEGLAELDRLAHSKQKFTYTELETMYLELKATYEKERVA